MHKLGNVQFLSITINLHAACVQGVPVPKSPCVKSGKLQCVLNLSEIL